MGVHVAQAEVVDFGVFLPRWPNGFNDLIFKRKFDSCVKSWEYTVFPYAQYIYVSLAFQKCTHVQGRRWVLRVICKNVTPFPMFWLRRSSKLLREARL